MILNTKYSANNFKYKPMQNSLWKYETIYIIKYTINVHSPSVNIKSSHHEPVVLPLLADIDSLPVSPYIRVGYLSDVGLVDDDVGLYMSRVDPATGEVLRQQTTRLDVVVFYWKQIS